jgi:hypothetical protein
MQQVGNAITVVGIAVTLVGYFGQHGLSRLRELEPELVAWWNRRRMWVMVKLRGSKSVTVHSAAGSVNATVTTTASGRVWSPAHPDDDLETRTAKLERNLDALRSSTDELRAQDQQRLRDLTEGLSARLTGLATEVAAWREEGQREATWAMRWEVRGLLITLVGTGMSLFG